MQYNDLISRSALLAAYDAAHKGPPGGARNLIEEAPGLDVAPVVHGRWIYKERHRKSYRQYTGYDAVGDIHTVTVLEETGGKEPYCSECGAQAAESYMDFCPHCGAKMDAPTCGPDYCEIGGEGE